MVVGWVSHYLAGLVVVNWWSHPLWSALPAPSLSTHSTQSLLFPSPTQRADSRLMAGRPTGHVADAVLPPHGSTVRHLHLQTWWIIRNVVVALRACPSVAGCDMCFLCSVFKPPPSLHTVVFIHLFNSDVLPPPLFAHLWFLWWIWPGVSLWEGEAVHLCCGCPALHTWTGWQAGPCRRRWQTLQDKAKITWITTTTTTWFCKEVTLHHWLIALHRLVGTLFSVKQDSDCEWKIKGGSSASIRPIRSDCHNYVTSVVQPEKQQTQVWRRTSNNSSLVVTLDARMRIQKTSFW